MAANFELHENVMFVQSTKIGIHGNKGIQSDIKDIFLILTKMAAVYDYNVK